MEAKKRGAEELWSLARLSLSLVNSAIGHELARSIENTPAELTAPTLERIERSQEDHKVGFPLTPLPSLTRFFSYIFFYFFVLAKFSVRGMRCIHLCRVYSTETKWTRETGLSLFGVNDHRTRNSVNKDDIFFSVALLFVLLLHLVLLDLLVLRSSLMGWKVDARNNPRTLYFG